jgi:uncharacterized protein YrrD
MLILQNRLIEVPIMSLQTGTQLGVTSHPIIDPRRLAIVAFYCEGPQIRFNPAILHIEDIRENSELGYIVDSSENIMPPDDLVRLKEILDFKFELIGKQVEQDDGHKLGKIVDYSTDSESFYIIKLHIKPTWLQSLTSAEHIIDRAQIKKITDNKIIVSQPTIADTKKPAKLRPNMDNPFRKQAEAAQTKEAEK